MPPDFDKYFEILNSKYEHVDPVGREAANFRQFNLSKSGNNRIFTWEVTSDWEVDIVIYQGYFNNFINICRKFFVGNDTDAIISNMIASIQPDVNNTQWSEVRRTIVRDPHEFVISIRRNGADKYQGKIILKSSEQNENSLSNSFVYLYKCLSKYIIEEFNTANVNIDNSVLWSK